MSNRHSGKPSARAGRPPALFDALAAVMVWAVPVVTVLAFYYPPALPSQGIAQRIFYIHVPVAWVALYSPAIAAVSGVLFLVTRRDVYDVWSLVATQLAALFAVGVVVSGPLWAVTEWGTWWNWKDQRLMSFFALLLSLGGYFIVRLLTENAAQRKAFSGAMAVVSALTALVTWFAIRVVEPDTHPVSVLGAMSPSIRETFWWSVLGYHLLFLVLFRLALRHEHAKRAVSEVS